MNKYLGHTIGLKISPEKKDNNVFIQTG